MIQVQLNQATQTYDVLEKLQALQFHLVLNRIALHSLAAAVTAGCVILLIRTAAGTLHSRFLKHLAFSVALNVVFRLGSIIDLLLKAGLAFITVGHVQGASDPVAEPVTQALATLDSTWHGIDVTISLLGSWFLLTTWHLLKRYPNEGINRSLYTTLTAFFGLGSIGVLTDLLDIAERIQKHLWLILDLMDIAAVTLGLILVGWRLQKTLGPKMKTENGVMRETIPWATAFLYGVWGAVQPFYPWLKHFSGYSILLLMAGVGAIIMTVILCSLTLEERPEYDSTNALQGALTQPLSSAKSG